MKKLISFIVVIAAIVVATPFIMGSIVQKNFKMAVNQMPLPSNVKAAVTDYQNGWLHSTGTVVFTINPKNKKPVKITLVEKISNGPVVFYKNAEGKTQVALAQAFMQTEVKLSPEQRQAIENTIGQIPDMYAGTMIKINGQIQTDFSSKGVEYKNAKNGIDINWKGFNGQWNVSANATQMSGQFTMGAINAAMDGATLKSSGFETNYNGHRGADSLWIGESNTSIPTLNSTVKNKPFINLAGFDTKASTDVTNGLFNNQVKISATQLSFNDKNYGPIDVQFTIGNLDAKALQTARDLAEKLQKSDVAPKDKTNQLTQAFVNVLTKGARFDLQNLSVNTPDGLLGAKGQVGITPLNSGEQANIPALMKNFAGDVKLNIPSALAQHLMARSIKRQQAVQQMVTIMAARQGKKITFPALPTAQQRLETLEHQGYLVLDGSVYNTHLTYNKGKLLINGKAYTPAPVPTPKVESKKITVVPHNKTSTQ